jgi:ribosomal protein S15P/S13E
VNNQATSNADYRALIERFTELAEHLRGGFKDARFPADYRNGVNYAARQIENILDADALSHSDR